ncbi:DNA polymerase IV [Sphingomonas sp.]|uniref:DNA polymerase IV n=1 Tax=Sphingomonas sp. TaxID=28214 RepID=UPI003B3B4054
MDGEEQPIRKIIHIDMDAFYASVEQRDNPDLRGKPVAVGGTRERGVVAAASYEARVYGIRSAMASVTARRRCPDLIFVKPRFEVYSAISRQIRAIFADYTEAIEPLSLDEAYLDVSGAASARAIAQEIRARIKADVGLTASAGVSYNKFIAKLASDQNKPDGCCVIPPERGPLFVESLPVKRFHGVGPKTAEKMGRLGIETGADLKAQTLQFLEAQFGSFAAYLYGAARGIDHRPVRSNRIRKSVGAERTFFEDISDPAELATALETVLDALMERIARAGSVGRTVTLKVKYSDFHQITRARSFTVPISERSAISAAGQGLLSALCPVPRGVRLLGLTLSALVEDEGEDDPLSKAQLGLSL